MSSSERSLSLPALDIDTHGLLLLTNNGKLAHAMLSPKKTRRENLSSSRSWLDESTDVRGLLGIELKDFTHNRLNFKIVELMKKKRPSLVEITLAEGKSSSQAHGTPVEKKLRISALWRDPAIDPELSLGEWRRLTGRRDEIFGEISR